MAHTIYVPSELHDRIKTLARYGTADDLIIECITESVRPRWEKWLKQEYEKLSYDGKDENGQGTIRRSSPPDAGQASEKDRKNKGKKN